MFITRQATLLILDTLTGSTSNQPDIHVVYFANTLIISNPSLLYISAGLKLLDIVKDIQ